MTKSVRNQKEPGSSTANAMARLIHLIPLLLETHRSREVTLALLDEALVESGMAERLPTLLGEGDRLRKLMRDLEHVVDLDLLVLPDRNRGVAMPGSQLPLWVTPDEAQALDAARMALEQLGMPEGEALATLLDRVAGRVRHPGAAPSLPASLRGLEPELWRALHDGVRRGRCMTVQYFKASTGQESTYHLDHARIAWMTGAFYVVAYCPDAEPGADDFPYQRNREFRVDRIRSLEVHERPTTRIDLPRVRCSFVLSAEMRGRVHPMVDRDGRPVQSVHDRPDGTLSVAIEEFGLVRARQRLLMFGENLRAVEGPPELVTQLREELTKMVGALGPTA